MATLETQGTQPPATTEQKSQPEQTGNGTDANSETGIVDEVLEVGREVGAKLNEVTDAAVGQFNEVKVAAVDKFNEVVQEIDIETGPMEDALGIGPDINVSASAEGLNVEFSGTINSAVFEMAEALEADPKALENPELVQSLKDKGLGEVVISTTQNVEMVGEAMASMSQHLGPELMAAGKSGELTIQDLALSSTWGGNVSAKADITVPTSVLPNVPVEGTVSGSMSADLGRYAQGANKSVSLSNLSFQGEGLEALSIPGIVRAEVGDKISISGQGLPIDIGDIEVRETEDGVCVDATDVLDSEVDVTACHGSNGLEVTAREIEGAGTDGQLAAQVQGDSVNIQANSLGSGLEQILEGVLEDGIKPALKIQEQIDVAGADSLANPDVQEELADAGVNPQLITLAQLAPEAFEQATARIPTEAIDVIQNENIEVDNLNVENLNASISDGAVEVNDVNASADVSGVPLDRFHNQITEGVTGSASVDVSGSSQSLTASARNFAFNNPSTNQSISVPGRVRMDHNNSATSIQARDLYGNGSVDATLKGEDLTVAADFQLEAGNVEVEYGNNTAQVSVTNIGADKDGAIGGIVELTENRVEVMAAVENLSRSDVQQLTNVAEDPNIVALKEAASALGLELEGPQVDSPATNGGMVEEGIAQINSLVPEGMSVEANVSIQNFDAIEKTDSLSVAEVSVDAEVSLRHGDEGTKVEVSGVKAQVENDLGETHVAYHQDSSLAVETRGDGELVVTGNDIPEILGDVSITSAADGIKVTGNQVDVVYNSDQVTLAARDVGEAGLTVDAKFSDGQLHVDISGIGKDNGTVKFASQPDGSFQLAINNVNSDMAQEALQNTLDKVVTPTLKLGKTMVANAPSFTESMLATANNPEVDGVARYENQLYANGLLESSLREGTAAQQAGASDTLVNFIDTFDLEAGVVSASQKIPALIQVVASKGKLDLSRVKVKSLEANFQAASVDQDAQISVSGDIRGVTVESLVGPEKGAGRAVTSFLGRVVKAPSSIVSWVGRGVSNAMDGNVVTRNTVGRVGDAMHAIGTVVTGVESAVLSPIVDTRVGMKIEIDASIDRTNGEIKLDDDKAKIWLS